MDQVAPRKSLAQALRQISNLLSRRGTTSDEAWLYYRRACLAATEERYDVALIFCRKSLDLDPVNLPTRLLIAQIEHRGLDDVDSAVVAYQKVITLAGYDPSNPYCAAARAGLDELVHSKVGAPPPGERSEDVPA